MPTNPTMQPLFLPTSIPTKTPSHAPIIIDDYNKTDFNGTSWNDTWAGRRRLGIDLTSNRKLFQSISSNDSWYNETNISFFNATTSLPTTTTLEPTMIPTRLPSRLVQPIVQPSRLPTIQPTNTPTVNTHCVKLTINSDKHYEDITWSPETGPGFGNFSVESYNGSYQDVNATRET